MVTTQITAEPAVPQLVVTSEFAAPRELLFRTYTDPDLLAQWLGPRGLTVTVDHLDPRHGGTWRCTNSDADGNKYFVGRHVPRHAVRPAASSRPLSATACQARSAWRPSPSPNAETPLW